MIEILEEKYFKEAAEVYLQGLSMEVPPGSSDVESLIEKLKLVKGFVFIKDSKVIGLITYTLKDQNIRLDFIASIVPRQGIGRQLMEKLVEFGKNNNLGSIFARESTEDKTAMGFYKSLGFEKYGEENEDGLKLNKIKLTYN